MTRLLCLILLLGLGGCADAKEDGHMSGTVFMQGVKDGKLLQIRAFGNGKHWDVEDSSGNRWQSKNELIYNEIFDSSDIGPFMRDGQKGLEPYTFQEMVQKSTTPEAER